MAVSEEYAELLRENEGLKLVQKAADKVLATYEA